MECAKVEIGVPGNELVVAAPLWSRGRTVDVSRPAD